MKKNNKKWVILIIIVIMIIPFICCGGCVLYLAEIEPIVWKIDENIKDDLEKNYQLTIPSNYKFKKGKTHNIYGLDNQYTMYINFDVTDITVMEDMLGEKWEKIYATDGEIEFMEKSVDVEIPKYQYSDTHTTDYGNWRTYEGELYYKIYEDKVRCYLMICEADV